MVRAIGVELDALLVVLGEKRVVIADPLDEAAVARAARIGDDDAVIGTLLGAAARQTNAECHCVPSSFFYSSPQRRLGRSEERRVGTECVSTCRSRGSP